MNKEQLEKMEWGTSCAIVEVEYYSIFHDNLINYYGL